MSKGSLISLGVAETPGLQMWEDKTCNYLISLSFTVLDPDSRGVVY